MWRKALCFSKLQAYDLFGGCIIGRFATFFEAERCGHADSLSAECRRTHDTGRTVGHVARRHDAASDEEVVQVGGHVTAVGYLVDALAVPLVAAVSGAEYPVRRVQVDGPAAVSHGVVVGVLFDDVLLGDGVESREAAAFTFAGEESRPLQREVFSLRELAGVLDVVPDAVNHAPEFEFDLLGVGHRVQTAAVFQPPVFAAVLGRVEIVGIL